MNKRYCFGEYTYHLENKGAKSIIDFGISNCVDLVENFRVDPTVMGDTIHSSHKTIECVVNLGKADSQESLFTIMKPPFKCINESNSENYSFSICNELKTLNPYLEKCLSNDIYKHSFCESEVDDSINNALKLYLEK